MKWRLLRIELHQIVIRVQGCRSLVRIECDCAEWMQSNNLRAQKPRRKVKR